MKCTVCFEPLCKRMEELATSLNRLIFLIALHVQLLPVIYEDNDGDDPEEADDEETSFDEDRFCRQILKIWEKAFARVSVLPHRQRKLLNRLQKTTT